MLEEEGSFTAVFHEGGRDPARIAVDEEDIVRVVAIAGWQWTADVAVNAIEEVEGLV